MEHTHNAVTIRNLKKGDRSRIAKLANNKKIWSNLRDAMPFPYTLEDADNFLEIVKQEDPLSTFAIEWKGKFVGVCGLILKTDIYRFTCEVGYWIGEPFWSKGIATVALDLLTTYAFNDLKMERVQTGVFEYNLASMRVLEKCGYEQEGIFKKAISKDGKLYNEVRYAKIR